MLGRRENSRVRNCVGLAILALILEEFAFARGEALEALVGDFFEDAVELLIAVDGPGAGNFSRGGFSENLGKFHKKKSENGAAEVTDFAAHVGAELEEDCEQGEGEHADDHGADTELDGRDEELPAEIWDEDGGADEDAVNARGRADERGVCASLEGGDVAEEGKHECAASTAEEVKREKFPASPPAFEIRAEEIKSHHIGDDVADASVEKLERNQPPELMLHEDELGGIFAERFEAHVEKQAVEEEDGDVEPEEDLAESEWLTRGLRARLHVGSFVQAHREKLILGLEEA